MEAQKIHTIAIYPRPHIDNICAIFLLKTFGAKHFPGIEEAKIDYWNQVPAGKSADEYETEGILLVDLGGGKFDHHHEEHATKTDCAATLVAKYLNIDQDPALRRLLVFAKRDDLEGRGIVSKDVIDRAFGLSAIVMNLNRDYPDHPEYVIETVSRIFLAHYNEQYRRLVLMPQEWEKLQHDDKTSAFDVATEHGSKPLHIVMVETDAKAMIGFLRAAPSIQADVVVQKVTSGHINIVTRQTKPRLNLHGTIAAVRLLEAKKKGIELNTAKEQLEKPGRLEQVEEWYYDTAANTLQNGGAATANIVPTKLSLADIRTILEKTLPTSLPPRPGNTHRTVSLNKLPPRPPKNTKTNQP